MTAENLLAELEPLTHAARMRRMVEVGSLARTDPDARAIVTELRGRGFYERYLALMSCYGSGDAAHALAALADPSRKLRGLALVLVAQIASDADAARVLEELPPRARLRMLTDLLRRKRRAVLDAFLERALDAADTELGELDRLLAFASGDLVERLLPRLATRFGTQDWARLARLHPGFAFDSFLKETEAQTESNPRLRLQINTVLPLLADRRPDDALRLARAATRHETLDTAAIAAIATHRPNEVADLMLEAAEGVRGSLGHVADRLTEARLLALLQTRPDVLGAPSSWLPKLPPSLRRAAWQVAGVGWQNAHGVVDAPVVGCLPSDVREPEARRNLALPVLATRPQQRLPYATFLPWDEAQAAVLPSLKNPDPDLRSAALSALIGAARYGRDRLPDVLALVRARANEQDPVRLTMLTALAALPPARWQSEHLEDLRQIVEDALGAADLSYATGQAAETLATQLVPHHPAWAAELLARLVEARGRVSLYGLESRLTDDDTRRIAPALLPVFTAWQTRERESLLVQAAASLGKRIQVFPELVALLEKMLETTRPSYLASSVLGILKKHRTDRLAALVPSLLQKDPSAITLPVVYEYLHRQRQNLLTPFLGQRAYSGRFLSGKTRWVLPLTSGFHRWTPGQQETFAQTLGEITGDRKRDTPSVLLAMRQLAALPAVAPVTLSRLAGLDNSQTAVRDKALLLMSHLDGGQGVPFLVEALNDKRARIAIYALRSAILEMPPPAALELLRAAPTDKVTVAKEVVRLLGEIKTPGAYPLLLDMARRDDPPPHRDIRVALLRALWDHLEADPTWPILDRAATDPDPAVARSLASVPSDRLSHTAQTRLLHLLATLLEHPDPLVRQDTLSRCRALPVADPRRILLPHLLARLKSPLPDEYGAAAGAVFSTYTGKDATLLGDVVGQVRGNRPVLRAITSALLAALRENRARFAPTLQATLDALETDPLTVGIRIELGAAGLPTGEFVTRLTNLAGRGELHAEAVIGACQAVSMWSGRRTTAQNPTPLQALEASLAQSPHADLRRVALAALIAQSSGTQGWTPILRARLEQYRSDPAPLVASAAQFTPLPPLTEPETKAV